MTLEDTWCGELDGCPARRHDDDDDDDGDGGGNMIYGESIDGGNGRWW